jgi:hypothetical protein
MSESGNPMLEQATKLNYPVEGTKIKFQGIANLNNNTVAIEKVEPLGAASEAKVEEVKPVEGANMDVKPENQPVVEGNGTGVGSEE